MRGILLIGVALSLEASAEQNDLPTTYSPNVPGFVQQAEDFVPTGWRLVSIESGDLNGDQRTDVTVLMRMTNPANIEQVTSSPYYETDDTNPYLLAIGFAQEEGFDLVATHSALFPREIAPMHGDDPPGDHTVAILRGVLSLTLGHLRGFERFRFRLDGEAFALIGYDCAGATAGDFSSLSVNYLTRKARYERGDAGSDDHIVSNVAIRPGELQSFEEIDWDSGWEGIDSHGDPLAC